MTQITDHAVFDSAVDFVESINPGLSGRLLKATTFISVRVQGSIRWMSSHVLLLKWCLIGTRRGEGEGRHIHLVRECARPDRFLQASGLSKSREQRRGEELGKRPIM